jgi:hypothetical protein
MNEKQWQQIKNFRKDEKTIDGRPAWGDPSAMDFYFISFLDTVRHLYGHPFVLTSPAYTNGTGHSDKSYHYKGRACDFYIPDLPADTAFWRMHDVLKDMGLMKDRVMIKRGFGFYCDWKPLNQGFHLDDRDEGKFWVRVDKMKHGYRPDYYYDKNGWDVISSLGYESILNTMKHIME